MNQVANFNIDHEFDLITVINSLLCFIIIKFFSSYHDGKIILITVNKLMFYHQKTRRFAACYKPVNLLLLNIIIVMTSHEQRLITKEHIATHTTLFLWCNSLNTRLL